MDIGNTNEAIIGFDHNVWFGLRPLFGNIAFPLRLQDVLMVLAHTISSTYVASFCSWGRCPLLKSMHYLIGVSHSLFYVNTIFLWMNNQRQFAVQQWWRIKNIWLSINLNSSINQLAELQRMMQYWGTRKSYFFKKEYVLSISVLFSIYWKMLAHTGLKKYYS